MFAVKSLILAEHWKKSITFIQSPLSQKSQKNMQNVNIKYSMKTFIQLGRKVLNVCVSVQSPLRLSYYAKLSLSFTLVSTKIKNNRYFRLKLI